MKVSYSRAVKRALPPSAVLVAILALGHGLAAEPSAVKAAFQTQIRLPIDLVTGDGIELAQGRYDLEVRLEQGHYALDAAGLAGLPPADVEISRIGDLMKFDLNALRLASHDG